MPEEFKDKIFWIVILLPGFLTISIISLVAELNLDELQFATTALGLTFLNLGIYLLLVRPIGLAVRGLFRRLRRAPAAAAAPAGASTPAGNWPLIIAMFAISIAMGVGLAIAAEADLQYRMLTAITAMLGDVVDAETSKKPLGYVLYLNSKGELTSRNIDGRLFDKDRVTEAWVRVRLKEGETFEGWPRVYSQSKEAMQIMLSPACSVTGERQLIEPIKGPGVLFYEDEIASMRFLDRPTGCSHYWNLPPDSRSSPE